MKLLKNWPTLVILVLIFSTRILSFNQDAAGFWADERHFQQLISKLEESKEKNDYNIAINTVFHLNARPGLGLWYFPAAILEWKNPSVPYGAYFNLIISSAILVVIYLIIKKVFDGKKAFFSTALLIFSMPSLIYLRHILPYDAALFLLLLGLFIYSKTQKAFYFGIISGLSFLTYASYYYIFPIPIVLALYYKSLKPLLLFVCGFLIVLFFVDFAYRSYDKSSYFNSLKEESAGVTSVEIGDYVPAFSFITQYIYTTDGLINIVLISSAIFIFLLQKKDRKITVSAIYFVIVFLIMEITSHILNTHVLYGRTVRPFYLGLLLWAAIVVINFTNRFDKKNIYQSLIIVLFILSWFPKFTNFLSLQYPEQFKEEARMFVNRNFGDKKIEELLFVNYFGINEPHTRMRVFREFQDAKQDTFYVVNANVIYPYFGSYEVNLYCKSEVLLKKPHIQTQFEPYLFEGWKEEMRGQAKKEPLFYQLIYCK